MQTQITEDVVEDKNRWLCANLDLSLVSQALLRPNVSGGRASSLLLQALRQVCSSFCIFCKFYHQVLTIVYLCSFQVLFYKFALKFD